ncbi:hypothetical protein G4X40_18475, partial [Rhodococcus sp. D2-41]|uniref:hypothetical protein n=1 Tax=Speluncibacter jeojiensis TaxID=2710754 RepID=UPI002410338B
MPGVFKRGQSASYMRVGTRHVVRAYLGEKVVWDGTRSAVVRASRLLAAGRMRAAAARADSLVAASVMRGSGAMSQAVAVSTCVDIAAGRMLAAGRIVAPTVTADALVAPVQRMTASGFMIPPLKWGHLDDGDVIASKMRGTAMLRSAVVSADALIVAPKMRATGRVRPASGDVTITAARMTAIGRVRPATGRGEGLRAPRLLGSGFLRAAHGFSAPYPGADTYPSPNLFPGGEQTGAAVVAPRIKATGIMRPATASAAPGTPPTYVGALAVSTTTATLSATPPAGVQAGDLLVWIVTTWDATIPSVPSGWTLGAATDGAGGVSSRTYVYSRRAVDGGTAGAAALSNAPSGGEHLGTVVAVRGSLGV